MRSGKLEQKSLPLPQKCLHHGGVMFAGEVVILSPLAQRSGQIAVHDYVSPHLNVFHLTKKKTFGLFRGKLISIHYASAGELFNKTVVLS